MQQLLINLQVPVTTWWYKTGFFRVKPKSWMATERIIRKVVKKILKEKLENDSRRTCDWLILITKFGGNCVLQLTSIRKGSCSIFSMKLFKQCVAKWTTPYVRMNNNLKTKCFIKRITHRFNRVGNPWTGLAIFLQKIL